MPDAVANTPSAPDGRQDPPALSAFMRVIAAVCLGECRERAVALEAFTQSSHQLPLRAEDLCRYRAEIEAMQALRQAIGQVLITGRPTIDLALPLASPGNPVAKEPIGREGHETRLELLSSQLDVLEEAGFEVQRDYHPNPGGSPNRAHKPTA